MALRVHTLNPDLTADRQDWQAFVSTANGATLFHELPWIDAVRGSFPHRPFLLVARLGEDIVGALPLFEVDSLLAGRMLVSVPYAVYGGVIGDHPDAAESLRRHAFRLVDQRRARCLDVRSITPKWSGVPTTDRYVTFRRALPQSLEEVWAMLPRKARAEARRAQNKHHLEVTFDDDGIDTVWSLYCQSMRRLGSPNLPRKFFRRLLEETPDRHLVSVIRDGDRPVAGLLSFIHGHTVMPYYSGAISEAGRMGANNYLYLTLMMEAVHRGLGAFDFGRTRVDNRGSFEFKRNQGFDPTPLGYQMAVPEGRPAPNLTPANRKFRWAQWAWRRMPLAVTRPLGSWLSTSIPG
jgi:FemAB-related protein (PEP-CTERM system-associated)